MLKRPLYLLAIALLVAWIFDLLFWRKSLGISFALYLGILVVCGLMLARFEDRSPARTSLLLIVPIGLLALMTTVRLEPLTIFLSIILSLVLLMILAHTLRGGRWYKYSLSDYFNVVLRIIGSAIARPPGLFKQVREESNEDSTGTRRSMLKSAFAILRGLLLAIPVVIVFAALLSAADPVFSNRLESLLDFFDLDRFIEYLFRGFYVLLFTYALVGIYLYTLVSSQEEKLVADGKPWIRRFLGFTEAAIVLGAVNLLFLSFLVVQFQYFFGGDVNINLEGFTYAQYARRGFGELVMVAFFSLLLFFALSTVTRRESEGERRMYSALGVLLGIGVGVILISAFQRLMLYESAFGFTRYRIYPHVFMVWLGVLLLGFIVLEVLNRQRTFGLILITACLGFALTLGLLNVDGLVVRRNVERAKMGLELDTDYLLTLSVDSTPVLVDLFNDPHMESGLHDQIGVVLACQSAELGDQIANQTWTGFHFSRWRARGLLEGIQEQLAAYPIKEQDVLFNVLYEGEEISCAGNWGLD